MVKTKDMENNDKKIGNSPVFDTNADKSDMTIINNLGTSKFKA